jgi:uncharacterized protein YbjQ (UPF0145 family)
MFFHQPPHDLAIITGGRRLVTGEKTGRLPYLSRAADTRLMVWIGKSAAICRTARTGNNKQLQGENMLVVTTENLTGHRVREVKGQVFGVVVRSRGLAGNVMAGLRSLFGGEITEYTQLLEEARRHAVDRMVKNAHRMGANAVVMMRFDSSEIGQTMSEIVAYGTAVVVDKVE